MIESFSGSFRRCRGKPCNCRSQPPLDASNLAEVGRCVRCVLCSQAGKYATRRLQHIKYQASHIKQWLEKTEATVRRVCSSFARTPTPWKFKQLASSKFTKKGGRVPSLTNFSGFFNRSFSIWPGCCLSIGQAKPKDLKEQELKEAKEAKENKEAKEANERSRLFPMVRAPGISKKGRRNATKQENKSIWMMMMMMMMFFFGFLE